MQSWLETAAADGFNIMFPTVPAGLDDFVTLVIPELQRRGIFRSDYEGTTLREHSVCPVPKTSSSPRLNRMVPRETYPVNRASPRPRWSRVPGLAFAAV